MKKTKHASIELAVNGFIVHLREETNDDSLWGGPSYVFNSFDDALKAVSDYFEQDVVQS